MRLKVVELATGEVVETISVRPGRDADRVLAGLLANMNTDDYVVDEEYDLLTVAEVAELWRVSKMTVYRMIHDGSLPAMNVGRRNFRIREEDLRANT